MYNTHPFTLHGRCPCQIGAEAVARAAKLFEAASSIAAFVSEMEAQRVIGKRIWYDECILGIRIGRTEE